jgi:hypothetical protein
MSGLKKGYPGSSIACACGRCARFVSWREKTVISLFGAVPLACSYDHRRHCRTGYRPWDEALRLSSRQVTPGAEMADRLRTYGIRLQTTRHSATERGWHALGRARH